jgi:hypothetical protein
VYTPQRLCLKSPTHGHRGQCVMHFLQVDRKIMIATPCGRQLPSSMTHVQTRMFDSTVTYLLYNTRTHAQIPKFQLMIIRFHFDWVEPARLTCTGFPPCPPLLSMSEPSFWLSLSPLRNPLSSRNGDPTKGFLRWVVLGSSRRPFESGGRFVLRGWHA